MNIYEACCAKYVITAAANALRRYAFNFDLSYSNSTGRQLCLPEPRLILIT